MLKALAIFAALAFATLPAPASAAPSAWALVTTAQGCTAYWEYVPSAETKASMLSKTSFSWEGSGCEKGELIDGEGTLTVMTQEDGNKYWIPYRGRMVAGALDGTLERLNKAMSCWMNAPFESCPWKVYDTQEFRMGCKAGDRECIPRKRLIPSSSTSVGDSTPAAAPPLRATASLEAHNPANEASDCLDLITKNNYERTGVSSTQGAVFRNRCPFPVEARWCIGSRCATGYDNLATMPAKDDRGISYDAQPGVIIQTKWAGCRQGFAYRPDFAGTLHYACK